MTDDTEVAADVEEVEVVVDVEDDDEDVPLKYRMQLLRAQRDRRPEGRQLYGLCIFPMTEDDC